MTKNFDFVVQLQETDPRLRSGHERKRPGCGGTSAELAFSPRDCLASEGRTAEVTYVLRGGQFEERVIEVSRRNREQLVITRGLMAGDQVALKDPTLETQAN